MPKHNIDGIARVAYDANRAYCLMVGDEPPAEWDALEEWQRQGLRTAVLQAIHGDASPEAMHENWRRVRVAEGWVLGEKLDRAKKVHPNLVAYDELPVEQKRKDRLSGAIVKALTVRM